MANIVCASSGYEQREDKIDRGCGYTQGTMRSPGGDGKESLILVTLIGVGHLSGLPVS